MKPQLEALFVKPELNPYLKQSLGRLLKTSPEAVANRCSL